MSVLLRLESSIGRQHYVHMLTDSRQKQYTPNSWVGDPAEKLSVINVECLIPDTLPYDCNTHTTEKKCVYVCV